MNTFRAAMPRSQNGSSSVRLGNDRNPTVEVALRQEPHQEVPCSSKHVELRSRFSVLILDAIGDYASSLVDALMRVGITATAFQNRCNFLNAIKAQTIEAAILILQSRPWWQDELRLFCNSIRHIQDDPEVEILCILGWPPKNGEEEAMNRVIGDSLRADVRHEW